MSNHDTHEPSGPRIGWCQANRCNARVEPGSFMCARHHSFLPTSLKHELSRLDHRGVLILPANDETLARLEIFARCVELVAEIDRIPVANPFRLRAVQLRRRMAGADAPVVENQPALFANPPGPEGGAAWHD